MQPCSVHIDRSEGKILLEHQESLVVPGNGRDDIQLQRLGKKPVLKACSSLDFSRITMKIY